MQASNWGWSCAQKKPDKDFHPAVFKRRLVVLVESGLSWHLQIIRPTSDFVSLLMIDHAQGLQESWTKRRVNESWSYGTSCSPCSKFLEDKKLSRKWYTHTHIYEYVNNYICICVCVVLGLKSLIFWGARVKPDPLTCEIMSRDVSLAAPFVEALLQRDIAWINKELKTQLKHFSSEKNFGKIHKCRQETLAQKLSAWSAEEVCSLLSSQRFIGGLLAICNLPRSPPKCQCRNSPQASRKFQVEKTSVFRFWKDSTIRFWNRWGANSGSRTAVRSSTRRKGCEATANSETKKNCNSSHSFSKKWSRICGLEAWLSVPLLSKDLQLHEASGIVKL